MRSPNPNGNRDWGLSYFGSMGSWIAGRGAEDDLEVGGRRTRLPSGIKMEYSLLAWRSGALN